jgi:hypothetical protein
MHRPDQDTVVVIVANSYIQITNVVRFARFQYVVARFKRDRLIVNPERALRVITDLDDRTYVIPGLTNKSTVATLGDVLYGTDDPYNLRVQLEFGFKPAFSHSALLLQSSLLLLIHDATAANVAIFLGMTLPPVLIQKRLESDP